MNVKLYFIRDQIFMTFVDLVKVHANDNSTNIGIKPFPSAKFSLSIDLVSISCLCGNFFSKNLWRDRIISKVENCEK